MEEEFEGKSRRKTVKILMFIIILAIIIGFVILYYYTMKTPKNIFAKSIEKAFEQLEEKNYESYKNELEVSMKIDSENQDIQTANLILNSLKIKLNQEIDLKNSNINEVATINFLGDDLINLEFIEQDEKIYFFEKNIFSKYIELPTEEINQEVGYNTIEAISQIQEIMNKKTLKEISKCIVLELKDKNYEQSKEKLTIEGETFNTTKSTLFLTASEVRESLKNILSNIKNNEKIMKNIENKEEIASLIDELINYEIPYNRSTAYAEFEISIYTKGIKNDVVKVELTIHNGSDDISIGMTKTSQDQCRIAVLNNSEELFNIKLENEKKDEKSGTLTATIDLTNFMNLMAEETYEKTKVIVKIKYNEEYNNKVEKADIQESVKLEELTEEDFEEMLENIEKTNWYTLLEQWGIFENSALHKAKELTEQELLSNTNTEVTLEGLTVKYNVPESFTLATSKENQKYYLDESINSVTVKLDKETKENYFELLKEVDALTADFYKNQEISGIKTITIDNREFSYRTITYMYEDISYEDTYYCYEIEKGVLYTVETSIEKDGMADADITNFLEINYKNIDNM